MALSAAVDINVRPTMRTKERITTFNYEAYHYTNERITGLHCEVATAASKTNQTYQRLRADPVKELALIRCSVAHDGHRILSHPRFFERYTISNDPRDVNHLNLQHLDLEVVRQQENLSCGYLEDETFDGLFQSSWNLYDSTLEFEHLDESSQLLMPSDTLDTSLFPPFPGDWSLFGHTSTDIESQNPNESTPLSADPGSYICKHCGKDFPRQCDLNKHMKLHDRPYRCLVKDCPKSWSGFIQQSHLDRHVNAMHREQLSESVEYYCPKESCRMQTWRKDGMKRHIKTQHPGEQGEPIRKIVKRG